MSSSAPATPAGTPPKSKSSPQEQQHVPAIVREVSRVLLCRLYGGSNVDIVDYVLLLSCMIGFTLLILISVPPSRKGMPTAITGEDDHEVLARRRGCQPGVALPDHQSHGKSNSFIYR